MFVFLTVVQALVAAALVGVILVQKSEGGGLGVGGGGGGPGGLMSARGAADFLTRSTAVLAGLFVILSIVLAAMAVDANSAGDIDTSLKRGSEAVQQKSADPLAGAAGDESDKSGAVDPAAPAKDDPLSGAAKQ